MSNHIVDMTGKVCGRLTVLRYSHTAHQAMWVCRCECGTETLVAGNDLRKKVRGTTSCGCWAPGRVSGGVKHGKYLTPEYNSWRCMKSRCYKKSDVAWPQYGGRGIKVCEEWKNDFSTFLRDMGPRPSPRHSLDRINNDGHYEPGNCRWATVEEQLANRRNSVLLEVDGRVFTVSELAEETNMHTDTLRRRLKKMSVKEAISVAVRRRKPSGYIPARLLKS